MRVALMQVEANGITSLKKLVRPHGAVQHSSLLLCFRKQLLVSSRRRIVHSEEHLWVMGMPVTLLRHDNADPHRMANYTYMSPEELVELLDRPDSFHKVAVVDCRDRDRDAGFIANSLHAPTISYTAEMYEQLAKQLFEEKKEVAVFHCAQSLIRGPKGANRFAMAQKEKGYPLPVVYVLRGGWESFYDIYGDLRPDLIYV